MATTRLRIRDRDRGYRKLMLSVETVGDHKLTVGVQDPEAAATHGDSRLTVGEIGAVHEFGGGHVPERSFIRATFDENEAKYRQTLTRIMRTVVLGKRSEADGLELLGTRVRADIQRRMSAGIPPPLQQETVVRKGSSTPLIDTGQLRSSVTYKVA
jgi:hypothetical protein